jgi:serine phosphatase RsbU (regulator of sigma subunit)
MTGLAPASPAVIEWGVASRPIPGESESGDAHIVAALDGGALVGAIDGLGHGPEAAKAARRAVDLLSATPSHSLKDLVERCHKALLGSRGAVMTLASLDARANQLIWTAVGNVEAILYRVSEGAPARDTIVPRSGVVGYQLPPLRVTTLPVSPGDVLVFATDGVDHRFVTEPLPRASAQNCANGLFDRYAKDTDDALVLVVRYLGRPS